MEPKIDPCGTPLPPKKRKFAKSESLPSTLTKNSHSERYDLNHFKVPLDLTALTF